MVTGAAGFIGYHLATRLLNEGREVLGVDSLTDYYSVSLKRRNLDDLMSHTGFTYLPLDLAKDDISFDPSEFDIVYHLAGQPGVRLSWGDDFGGYVRNNIVATQRLLEALRNTRIRLVVASSSSVYGEADRYPTDEDSTPKPSSPYGVTKLCAEQLALAYRRSAGIDARCVRYFTVYGPRQRPDMAFSRFIAAAKEGQSIGVYGDGNQTRDFTYVSDAVEATIRCGATEDPGPAVYNVGGGSRVTVLDVIDVLEEVLGYPVRIKHLSPQPGDVRNTGADLSLAERVLGWHPQVDLATGLRAQVEDAAA